MRTRWRGSGVFGCDVVVLGGEVTLIFMFGEELIFFFSRKFQHLLQSCKGGTREREEENEIKTI